MTTRDQIKIFCLWVQPSSRFVSGSLSMSTAIILRVQLSAFSWILMFCVSFKKLQRYKKANVCTLFLYLMIAIFEQLFEKNVTSSAHSFSSSNCLKEDSGWKISFKVITNKPESKFIPRSRAKQLFKFIKLFKETFQTLQNLSNSFMFLSILFNFQQNQKVQYA